jgi:protein tyrosine phosphatase (PTP) superfamily phosphohydrolase (DUF442 family)
MKTQFTLLLLMGLIIAPTGCMTNQRGFPPKDQIVNYDRVDEKLCRGAQPNSAGLAALAKDGVTLVINLRQPADGWVLEYAECGSLGMTYVNVPLSGTESPKLEDVKRVIDLINTNTGKVFVHCQYGCDRTGTIVACYRITKGMKPEDAFNDAKFHGISALLPHFKSFILHFQP